MNIFYYTWFEHSAEDIYSSLILLGHSVKKCFIPIQNHMFDKEFNKIFIKEISTDPFDLIISFNFIPIISNIAEQLQIPYVSWVFDNPHFSLYTNPAKNSCNFIFTFDKRQYEILKQENITHVYHMPLAVNTKRLNELLQKNPWETTHTHDISFVGTLYENNFYRQLNYLPEYLKGYIDGLIATQNLIYGENIIYSSISDKILEELQKYIILGDSKNFYTDVSIFLGDIISVEATYRERLALLSAISEHFSLALFSDSDKNLIPNVNFGGYIDYLREMPNVFSSSKINLNITLRSIASGIPLRALDIMGAGGFLLSNYQKELDEFFVEGEEIVMFDSKEDLLQKSKYYLENTSERIKIAKRGWEKIQSEYTYQKALSRILQIVFS